MQTNLLKWVFPFVALAVGVVGFMGINAIAQEPEKKKLLILVLRYKLNPWPQTTTKLLLIAMVK
ncbi:hypothetical protein P20652_0618 [Pseudoalteromonas sp. BSi20652]|nr:hypothetical protein P20652_0618 [Pseudoalteromonas sp. BSi20652]